MSRIPIAIVTIALLAGCGEGFDPASRLTSLRVLAVQSEPVAPLTGETTTLTPLVHPSSDATVAYAWSWCPFTGPAGEGYPCLVAEDELAALGAGEFPPYDLGSGETASFENTLEPGVLEAACQGGEDQPALIDCLGGFPVTIKLTVTAGDERVDAVRELRLRFRDEDEANANPTIDGLVAELDDGDAAIDEAGSVTLRRREERVIRAEVPEDVVEPYTGEDDAGEPEDRRERIVLSWFVETGALRYEQTSYVPDVVPELAVALKNEWEPDPDLDFEADVSALVVVVRDDRNGVAWTRGVVTLGDPP